MRLKPGTKRKRKELADKLKNAATGLTGRTPPKKPAKKPKAAPAPKPAPEAEAPGQVSVLEEFTRLPEEAKIDTTTIIKPVIPTPEELAKTSTERLEDLLRQKPAIEQLTEAVKTEPPTPTRPTPTPTTQSKVEDGQEPVMVIEPSPEATEGEGMEVEVTDNKYGLKGTDLKMSDGSPYRPKIRVGKGKIIAEMYFLVGDMPYLITRLFLKVSRHPMRSLAWPAGAIINTLLPEGRITTFNWRGATFELDTNKVYRVTPEGFCCWYWIQLMEPRDVFPVDPDQKPRHQPVIMGTSGTSTVVSHLIMGSRVLEKFASKLSNMETNQQSFTLPVVIVLLIVTFLAGLFIGIYLVQGHVIKDVVSPHTPVFILVKSLLRM